MGKCHSPPSQTSFCVLKKKKIRFLFGFGWGILSRLRKIYPTKSHLNTTRGEISWNVRLKLFHRGLNVTSEDKHGARKIRAHCFLETGTMRNQEPHQFCQMPVSTPALTDSGICDYSDMWLLIAKSCKPNEFSFLAKQKDYMQERKKGFFLRPTLLFWAFWNYPREQAERVQFSSLQCSIQGRMELGN